MIRKICEECGGKIEHVKKDYFFLGKNLGKFLTEICTKCGEEVFDETVSKQIDKIVKQKGMWNIKINQIVHSL